MMLLLCSCKSPGEAPSPFTSVLPVKSPSTGRPQLVLVVDGAHRGAAALDAFVAKHARAALRAAAKHPQEGLMVVFFFRDVHVPDHGTTGGFSVPKLEKIARMASAGTTFRSVQAWPMVRFSDL